MNLTPHTAARHWSAAWLGRAWSPWYTCWSLVREVQALQFGRAVPEVDVNDAEAVRHAIRQCNWRAVGLPPVQARAGDVIRMRGDRGAHIALAMGNGRVLHNVGGMRNDGKPFGGVCIDPIVALGALGFGRLKVWQP
jgi:hypothetical protein